VKKPKTAESDSDVFQGAIVRLENPSVAMVDQDELQLMDECDEEWVRAWRSGLSRRIEEKACALN
jgi:hypothetical protein